MIGGVCVGFVQLGMPEFLANDGESFLGRPDVAVVCIESPLVNGEAGKYFAAVEIVLRKADQPQPGPNFIALLHEVAALVNFSQKQAYCNVIGDFPFDAGKFARSFIDPNKTMYLGKNCREARRGFECRVRIHFVFGECSVAIRVNRNALCVASIRSSRSFFLFAYFARPSRCDLESLTSCVSDRASLSRSARYAAESPGLPSSPIGMRNMPVPEGITRAIFTDAGAGSPGFLRLSTRSMRS